MAEELLDAMGLECRDRLVAAVGIELGRLPESARSALTSLAQMGPGAVDGFVQLVELARDVAVDEVEAPCDYPLFRADESVTVTVTVGDLVEQQLPEDTIGVGWADRDECRAHALAGARSRPAADRNVRGIVLWMGMGLDCAECRRPGGSVGSGGERPAVSGELCTCGRPARVVFITERWGEVGWCGSEWVRNVAPCPFCGTEEAHQEPWGEPARCAAYTLCPTNPSGRNVGDGR